VWCQYYTDNLTTVCTILRFRNEITDSGQSQIQLYGERDCQVYLQSWWCPVRARCSAMECTSPSGKANAQRRYISFSKQLDGSRVHGSVMMSMTRASSQDRSFNEQVEKG
jgi:hypothetical protein